MELVKLTHENIDKEHICCAISNNKDIQVISKKNWLKDRLDEGLVILSSKKKMGFLLYNLFYDGQLVTHEILSEKKFDKILADKGM